MGKLVEGVLVVGWNEVGMYVVGRDVVGVKLVGRDVGKFVEAFLVRISDVKVALKIGRSDSG